MAPAWTEQTAQDGPLLITHTYFFTSAGILVGFAVGFPGLFLLIDALGDIWGGLRNISVGEPVATGLFVDSTIGALLGALVVLGPPLLLGSYRHITRIDRAAGTVTTIIRFVLPVHTRISPLADFTAVEMIDEGDSGYKIHLCGPQRRVFVSHFGEQEVEKGRAQTAQIANYSGLPQTTPAPSG
jgi:hypothetical protein